MVDKRLVKNLRIDPKLWKKAKIEAVKHNMTLQDFIAVAIKDKLTPPCKQTANNQATK